MTYTGHEAKDRAEYDEATRFVLWLRARAKERVERGHIVRGQLLAIAANQIAESFVLPSGAEAAQVSAPPAPPTVRVWELYGGRVRLFEDGHVLRWSNQAHRWYDTSYFRDALTDEDALQVEEWEAAVEAYRSKPPAGPAEPR
jgi:hypothetical protein